MTAAYLINLLADALLVWLAAAALCLVGYLAYLQLKEIRRNRRMDAKRERLGLRRA